MSDDDDNVIDISNSMWAEQEVNAARRRRGLPDGDPRFTFGLLRDVAGLLAEHGYPPLDGRQLVDLQAALFGALYGEGGPGREEEP